MIVNNDMREKIKDKFKSYDSIEIFSDEESITRTIVEKYNLDDYCVKTKLGWKISFVGFIIRKNSIIISFPKKYKNDITSVSVDDVDLLLKLISKITTTSPIHWDTGEVKNSFPLKAYLDICNYYVQHGFHFSQAYSYTYGYSGKIDWSRTLKYSPNYIQGKQVHYIPYVISKKNQLETIITSAMKYVLEEGYKKVGEYFEIGVPYLNHEDNRKTSEESTLSELRYIKSKIFNDYELGLVNSLIAYFEWRTRHQDEFIMITMNFEMTWQKICDEYLMENLDSVLNLSTHTENININYSRIKTLVKNQLIVQEEREDRKVIYDYLITDGEYVLIFDSKYYLNVDKDLDYKQLAYHYLIRLHDSVSENHKIINALLAPTESMSYSSIHIDLTTNNSLLFNGVRILIYNLNTKEVMKNYVN